MEAWKDPRLPETTQRDGEGRGSAVVPETLLSGSCHWSGVTCHCAKRAVCPRTRLCGCWNTLLASGGGVFWEYTTVLRSVLGGRGPFESPHCLLQGSRTRRASSGCFTTTGIVKPAERLPAQHCYSVSANESKHIEGSRYLFRVPPQVWELMVAFWVSLLLGVSLFWGAVEDWTCPPFSAMV